MKKFFSIYKNCVHAAFAQAAAYRLNFLLSLVIAFGFNALFPLITIFIYNSGSGFPDWAFYEVLLIQSVFMLSNGLASIMFNGVFWVTKQSVQEGNFEIILLKPLNPLFYLISTNFEASNAGLVIGGIVMFTVSAAHTGIASALAVAQFLLLFAAGFFVMAGMYMLMAALSFKWVGNSRLPEIFDNILNFGKYPISVFPKTIQGLTSFVIPVSMIGFFPASALLGRIEVTSLIAAAPCVLFLLFGIWVYLRMVKHYEGVGG